MQEEHSIANLCDALAVSRSGYHAWAARAPGPRAQADAALWPLIEQAYAKSRQTYGSPRIRQWLGRHGQKCSRHRVARLMRGHRMASQTKRRFRVALTDSNHDLPIAPNLHIFPHCAPLSVLLYGLGGADVAEVTHARHARPVPKRFSHSGLRGNPQVNVCVGLRCPHGGDSDIARSGLRDFQRQWHRNYGLFDPLGRRLRFGCSRSRFDAD